jgi:hypothetical protein
MTLSENKSVVTTVTDKNGYEIDVYVEYIELTAKENQILEVWGANVVHTEYFREGFIIADILVDGDHYDDHDNVIYKDQEDLMTDQDIVSSIEEQLERGVNHV